MAFAQRGGFGHPPGNSITKTIDNQGVNVQTDTNQKQDCTTVGGSSGIANSCTATPLTRLIKAAA